MILALWPEKKRKRPLEWYSLCQETFIHLNTINVRLVRRRGRGMDARVTTPISVSMVLPSISRRKRSTNITLPYTAKPLLCHSRPRIRRKRASTALVTFSSSSVSAAEASTDCGVLEVADISAEYRKWQWKGQYSISYFVSGPFSNSPPSPRPSSLLLVHGFGASIPHWRRNIATLSEKYTVYAIDLLGFGTSDKPAGFAYTMEAWAQLILDFLDEIVRQPAVLVGNSVGSLACLIAASECCGTATGSKDKVSGLVLLNCAGGMNNKAIVDDWRIKLLLPLFWLIDFLLKQRGIASMIFERVKQRDNLKNILLSVYGNKAAVDDELVEIIRGPANDEGALDAFISILTGPPGPNPVQLMPTISLPVLVLWGDQDPFTPLDGPVGKYFSALPSNAPNVSLSVLQGVGHCPHDDRPDLVHQKLVPWLDRLSAF